MIWPLAPLVAAAAMLSAEPVSRDDWPMRDGRTPRGKKPMSKAKRAKRNKAKAGRAAAHKGRKP
jgi:hypothetical protein